MVSKYASKRPTRKYNMPYKKRVAVPRRKSTYTKTATDSQTMNVTSYFELTATPSNGAGGNISFSLLCDPFKGKVSSITSNDFQISHEGLDSSSPDVNGIQQPPQLSFPRLAAFRQLYREYRTNSVRVEVLTDEGSFACPISALTDRANSTPCANISEVMSQAHTSKSTHSADRTLVYSWKPSSVLERAYHTCQDQISADNAHFIKVFQAIVGSPENLVQKHRVSVTMSVTMRDSKGPALN